jgi:hypothetical protein
MSGWFIERTCHTCAHPFTLGEYAWASDVNVIDLETGRARMETRYTCDECEAKE